MNRRTFLAGAALAPLAACTLSSGAATIDVATISADVQNVDAGVLAIAASPLLQALLPAADLAAVTAAAKAVDGIAKTVTAVSGQIEVPTAQNWVQAITADVALITPVLTGPSLPASVTQVLTAVQTLLPVLELAVALVPAVAAGPARMTPAEARAILANLAK